MQIVKLEGENRFVKNLDNNTLLNTDHQGLTDYKQKKQAQMQMGAMHMEINNMKNEMAEIKSLLVQLLQKSSSEK